jgi:toxin-antitoxin system PIN domain toxin
MLLPDVNVLLYAHRRDSHPEHPRFAEWVTQLANGPEPFALSVLVLAGVVRIATNARIFRPASSLDEALAFTDQLVSRPTARVLGPGPRHWALLTRLCRGSGATAKLVADAAHAAVALEHGCTLVTTDSDFGRFPELRWRHPLAPA